MALWRFNKTSNSILQLKQRCSLQHIAHPRTRGVLTERPAAVAAIMWKRSKVPFTGGAVLRSAPSPGCRFGPMGATLWELKKNTIFWGQDRLGPNWNWWSTYLVIQAVTLLGWCKRDPLKGLSDLQLGDEKVNLNHLVHIFSQLVCVGHENCKKFYNFLLKSSDVYFAHHFQW